MHPLMYILPVVQSTREATMLDVKAYCCDELLDAMRMPMPIRREDGAGRWSGESLA